uniref:Uncharacterized protein n=1 Tax=Arion vulgaris TaxID=1028688 RepID=A0A0B7AB08_9EUPU
MARIQILEYRHTRIRSNIMVWLLSATNSKKRSQTLKRTRWKQGQKRQLKKLCGFLSTP